MYKYLFIAFFIYIHKGYCQLHPESSKPGCCSEKTQNEYTYDPEIGKEYFMVYEVNKSSEKSLFYTGKFDPWKNPETKDNPLYNQIFIVPPGTLPIGKGVYMDQTEVANIHYQEFLFFISKDSAKYVDRKYEPSLDNKFKTKYFKNPEFYFFPVTGVTHDKAQAYCKWRADKLNVGLKEMLRGSSKKYKYVGRLPTESEWTNTAGVPSAHISDVHYTINKEELKYLEDDILANRFSTNEVLESQDVYSYNANFHVDPTLGIDLEIPYYIYGFQPATTGFYNMYGNVKEIVAEGYSIGGSFKTPYDPDKLTEHDDIQAYRIDVGFRCICEIARRQ